MPWSFAQQGDTDGMVGEHAAAAGQTDTPMSDEAGEILRTIHSYHDD